MPLCEFYERPTVAARDRLEYLVAQLHHCAIENQLRGVWREMVALLLYYCLYCRTVESSAPDVRKTLLKAVFYVFLSIFFASLVLRLMLFTYFHIHALLIPASNFIYSNRFSLSGTDIPLVQHFLG